MTIEKTVAKGFRRLAAILLCALTGLSPLHAKDAATLKARHEALRNSLVDNPFKRPLHLESSEAAETLNGDIYARIDQAFPVAGPALQELNHWCDILILHLNVKACRSSYSTVGQQLHIHVGRKHDQPLADTHLIDFRFKVVASTPDYLQIVLDAAQGPLGTRDYRILLEVVALDATHSFLHLSYSYAYGLTARTALRGYLATLGRDKIGFSIVDRNTGGEPEHVAGVRGLIERNTMRYYLAVEAYLDTLSAPASSRVERRLSAWHAGIERYPAQLHELERAEYLDMKRKELARQNNPRS